MKLYLKNVIILTCPISFTFRIIFLNDTDKCNFRFCIINGSKKYIKAQTDKQIISEDHITLYLQSCSDVLHECIHARIPNLQKREENAI